MGLIKQSFIENIYEQVDIVEVVASQCSDLKKRGKTWFCNSPFTNEKTPSFAVDSVKQRFKCFSSGKGGNAVTFIMETKGKTFPEAIHWLAEFKNLQVEYENAEWAKKALEAKNKKEELRPLLKASLSKYQTALWELPTDHAAQLELQKRGYNLEIAKDWGLGFAPGKDFIYSKVAEIGKTKEAREIGLIGETQDKYWNRLIYPIHDKNDLLIGFAGRDLSNKANSAKWINPAESIVYHKDKTLFGLNRAAAEIQKRNEVYLVEGYNDVIAWHRFGLDNTVAPCGTAITDSQITLLKKLTTRVCFTMDGDAAGQRSALKHIPAFIKAGFSTTVILLPECDPDDFVREYAPLIGICNLPVMFNEPQVKKNGFQFLMEHELSNSSDLSARAKAIHRLCEVISSEQDNIMKEIYTEWLAKESGRKLPTITRLIKEIETETQIAENVSSANNDVYELPKELEGKVHLKDITKDIEKYGIFQAGNRIWVKRGSDTPYTFQWVSNFSIEIIQHMNDEKFPMKLLRITNVFNKEKIFDTQSENLMSPMSFSNVVAGHGNFFWKGGRQEHLQLLQMLFDKMGDGEKIDVLGWQKAGFFVFNNRVVFPDKPTKDIDENGVFKVQEDNREISYYVPSANRVYKNNPYKYEAQKKVRVIGDSSLTFTSYASKLMLVHREHAITGLLFTMASMFQDIVVNQLGNFPMVFLYGPPSTGKDQLIECCQSFYGLPQTAINLEGGASTAKAQLRELAQFCNLITHLSEYKRGDAKLDGMLKGMWDRRGYKRGTIDSHVGSESIPVLSSVFLTGNDYPDQDALITRLIWEEMSKTDFDVKEMKDYEDLKDMYKAGVSHLTVDIMKHRSHFEDSFKSTYSRVSKELKNELAMAATHSRIISNLAVLGATYELMKDHLMFPFGWAQIVNHFRSIVDKQVRKLNSASIHNKWWDCFLAVCRTNQQPLRLGLDFNIVDNRLYFNWTNTYNRVAPQWYKQYYETAPSKGKISDMINEDRDLALEKHNAHRFDGGKNGHRTSAWSIDLKATGIMDELIETMDWQRSQNLDKPELPNSPATPFSKNDPKQDDLPF